MLSIPVQQNIENPLKIREKFVESIKVYLVIKPLQYIYRSSSEKRFELYESSPEKSIGNDLYKMLDKHTLKLIPKFEDHDLKHLVLDYGMSSIEEIKMQAYLFGNGSKSIFCLLFLASGILFPRAWFSFYEEYKKGKEAPSIQNLSIDDCMKERTETIRMIYSLE